MDAQAIVQQAETAYASQDLNLVEALFHPDVEVYWNGKKSMQGRDAVMEFETRNFASWHDFRIHKTLRAATGNTIAVEWEVSFISNQSGDKVEVLGAEFWTIEDGLLKIWQTYTTNYVTKREDLTAAP